MYRRTIFLALLSGAFCLQAETMHVFTVVFRSNPLPRNAVDVVTAAGGIVARAVPEVSMLEVVGPASLMGKLNSRHEIESATPTLQLGAPPVVTAAIEGTAYNLNGPGTYYEKYQWDIKQVTNNGESFLIRSGTHSTVVAVLDSGINTQHPDLAVNLLGGRNFVADGPGGAVVANDIEDRHGHGSHIAGTIAGNGFIYGVGPNLGLRVYRVLGASNTGPSTGIIAAMVAAANDGADVISMSIGGFNTISGGFWTAPSGTVYRYRDNADMLAYTRAVRYAIGKGTVVVVGAGNSALDISNPTVVTAYLNSVYGSSGMNLVGAARVDPAGATGVVTVSATARSLAPASYTNYGVGVIKVAAPGGEFTDGTLSASRASGGAVNTYAWMFGTSMATPKVSAVAALIIDQARANGQKLTPAQVVTRLQQSATDLGKVGYDAFYGYGMVNAVSALTMR